MKERPIIFSGESVRAILAGRKTQTRRALGAFLPSDAPSRFTPCDHVEGYGFFDTDGRWFRCPFGRPGDRLWVRESHWRYTGIPVDGRGPVDFVQAPDGNPYQARCYDDNPEIALRDAACVVVRVSPIHMPRWASRLTLEVVSGRVERLQAITEADAKAEGAQPGETTDGDLNSILGFIDTWDALNAKRGHPWDANPWVWVVEFKKVEASE